MAVQTVDQLDNELLFDSRPKRVVCLVPSISELIAHYEPYINLVGVTRFCTHPKALRLNKAIIGGTKDPNIELITSLQPDMIIANKEENTLEDISALQKHFPVWVSNVVTIDDALSLIIQLESLLQIPSKKQLFKSIRASFESIDLNIKKSVAYIIWNKPLMMAGKKTFINSWIEKIGLTNVSNGHRYPEASITELQKLKPDFIFLSSEPYPFKEKNKQEFETNFPTSKIVLVDGRIFSWYGSAMLEAPAYFQQLKKKLST